MTDDSACYRVQSNCFGFAEPADDIEPEVRTADRFSFSHHHTEKQVTNISHRKTAYTFQLLVHETRGQTRRRYAATRNEAPMCQQPFCVASNK